MSLLPIVRFAILRNIPQVHIDSLVFYQILLLRHVLLIYARKVYGWFHLFTLSLRRNVLFLIIFLVTKPCESRQIILDLLPIVIFLVYFFHILVSLRKITNLIARYAL